jgi:hypothetical protein
MYLYSAPANEKQIALSQLGLKRRDVDWLQQLTLKEFADSGDFMYHSIQWISADPAELQPAGSRFAFGWHHKTRV